MSSWGKRFEPIGDLYFFNRAGELLWIYNGDIHSFVESISISADGEYIAASDKGYQHGKVYFFNKAGELLWSYKTEGSVNSLSMSADGKYVVTGRYCDEVYFIDSGVITTPSPTSTPEHSSSTPETPSYEAIFAISGLLPIAYLLLRRRRDRAKRG